MRGFGAFLRRLRGQSLVRRWNFHYTIKDENVAEHSYWVAIYAMILADMEHALHPQAERYDMEKVMRGALLHDWEESITSDLPSLVKRTCKEDWSKVEMAGFEQLMAPIKDSKTVLYEYFWGLSRQHPVSNQESERYRVLLKCADLIDRLAYAYDEQQRGNKTFDRIVAETTRQLKCSGLDSVDELLHEWGLDFGLELPELMTHL